jgi:hypothetical protein
MVFPEAATHCAAFGFFCFFFKVRLDCPRYSVALPRQHQYGGDTRETLRVLMAAATTTTVFSRRISSPRVKQQQQIFIVCHISLVIEQGNHFFFFFL